MISGRLARRRGMSGAWQVATPFTPRCIAAIITFLSFHIHLLQDCTGRASSSYLVFGQYPLLRRVLALLSLQQLQASERNHGRRPRPAAAAPPRRARGCVAGRRRRGGEGAAGAVRVRGLAHRQRQQQQPRLARQGQLLPLRHRLRRRAHRPLLQRIHHRRRAR